MDAAGGTHRLTPEESKRAEALARMYSKKIRYVARSYLGPEYARDIEDVVQDTYEAICKQLDQFSSYKSPEALIVTITMRAARRYRHKNQRYVPLEADIAAPEVRPLDLEELLPRSTSEKDREILTRTYVYQETSAQAALELGEQESTVRQRLKRARDRLKNRLIQIEKRLRK